MPFELNYHHLYYFWRSARAGSMTAAARELHVSQSALSLQLKELEKSLGRRLFERTREGVAPTADGRLVLERCERIFTEGEALTASLRTGARAAVPFRVGVAAGLGSEVVMAVLDRLDGGTDLIPTVHKPVGAEVLTRLMRRQLDVGFFSADVSSQLGPAFRCRRLDAVPLLFVAAPAVARRLGPFPRRGRQYPMLMRLPEHNIRKEIDEWMRRAGVGALLVAETAEVDLLRLLALQGRGITVLQEHAVHADLRAGRLVEIEGAPREFVHEIWIAVPLRAPAEPAAERAVEKLFAFSPLFPRISRRR